MFFVSINDIYCSTSGNVLLYHHNDVLFSEEAVVKDVFNDAAKWFQSNKLAPNETKTQEVTFSLR